jgi:hypothetical protein
VRDAGNHLVPLGPRSPWILRRFFAAGNCRLPSNPLAASRRGIGVRSEMMEPRLKQVAQFALREPAGGDDTGEMVAHLAEHTFDRLPGDAS